MRRYSHRFSDIDIARVKDAILSTQVDLINGVPFQRLVSNDPISRALADADLAAIGMFSEQFQQEGVFYSPIQNVSRVYAL